MKYTREQVEEATKIYNDVVATIGYKLTPGDKRLIDEKFPQLPKTGLVVCKNSNVIIYRTGHNEGYGFNVHGEFDNDCGWIFGAMPNNWRPANKEDEERWKELLIEEAIRLGYLKGTTVKPLDSNKVEKINGTFFMNKLNELCAHDFGSLCFGQSIMEDGKWAKKIEEGKVPKTRNGRWCIYILIKGKRTLAVTDGSGHAFKVYGEGYDRYESKCLIENKYDPSDYEFERGLRTWDY